MTTPGQVPDWVESQVRGYFGRLLFGPLVARQVQRVNNVQSAPRAGVLTGLTEKLFEVAQDNLFTEAEFNAKMWASSLLFTVLDAMASTLPI